MQYPIRLDETNGVQGVAGPTLLKRHGEPGFDAIVEMARDLFDVPVCLISLIDSKQQRLKASSGLVTDGRNSGLVFCNYTVMSIEALVVEDASLDDRFHDHPAVTGDSQIRFYAGVPLSMGGFIVGSFCIIDHKPRAFSAEALIRLRNCAALVVRMLEQDQSIQKLEKTVAETQARSADKMDFAARHDALTGLANRAEFQRLLRIGCEERAKGKDALAVLALDLDRFKAVNDALGHAAGDRLLAEVAKRLKSIFRSKDVVARLGGDEFAIMTLTQGDIREKCHAFASRILGSIRRPFDIDGRIVHLGGSIGISLAPEHGVNAETLTRRANAALEKVKLQGKNNYAFFERELEDKASQRQELEADLRVALEREEFELVYQPEVDLADGRVTSAEALVRWRHPRRGMIQPELFIPLAEETGLIVPIGEWVFQQACQDAMSWPEDVPVAVNLSAAQLEQCGLFAAVTGALASTKLPASRLVIEVTETIFLRDDKALLSDLYRLHDLGIKLALDDFGTGYASLGYLKKVPFNKIKIDKSFIADIDVNPQSKAIVRAVVNLARDLHLETTAEGIETQSQADILCASGCERGQGYLFSHPVARAELFSFRGSFAHAAGSSVTARHRA